MSQKIKNLIQQFNQKHQQYLNTFIQQFIHKINKIHFLKSLKLLSYKGFYSHQNSTSFVSFYNNFYDDFLKLIQHKLKTIDLKISQGQNIQFTVSQLICQLIELYQNKINTYLVNLMKQNSLLTQLTKRKLSQIANKYHVFVLQKYKKIYYTTQSNPNKLNNGFYLLIKGKLEKTRLFYNKNSKILSKSFSHQNNQNHKNNQNRNEKTQDKQKSSNQNKLSSENLKKYKNSTQNQNQRYASLQKRLQNVRIQLFQSNLTPSNKINLIKSNKNNKSTSIKTIINEGQFIGDQFIYFQFQEVPYFAQFSALNQDVVLMKFDTELIIKFMKDSNIFSYPNQNQSSQINKNQDQNNLNQFKNYFYQNKLKLQAKNAKNLKKFFQKYYLKRKIKQQKKMARQISPEMQSIRQGIAKRHVSSVSNALDNFSPKQINKFLNKKIKRLGINKFDLDNPVVQVFQNHSQKSRSYQNCALAPLAIVKTRTNDSLFNNQQNILNKGQKSQTYKVRSWNSKYSIDDNGLSLQLKHAQQVVKKRRKSLGGFNARQNQRIIQKYKKNIKF